MNNSKNKRKLTKCICDNCGIEFEKPQSEYNRNLKLNRRNFCSRTCTGKQIAKNFGDGKNRYDISKHSGNLRNEFSPFRYHLRNVRQRDFDYDLDLPYLKSLWEEQGGICPFSGIKLILYGYKKGKKDSRYSASLDRIDSNLGYVKGNVRWVSTTINYMKNSMTDEELIDFIDEIIKNKKRED